MRNSYRIFALFTLLCLFALSITVQAQDDAESTEPSGVIVTAVSGAVNVRSGPGTEYIVRGTMPPGLELVATGRNDYAADFFCTGVASVDRDAWLRVTLTENVEGWVNLCVVEVTGEDTSLPVAEPAFPELIVLYEEIEDIEGDPSPIENPLLVTVTLAQVVVRSGPGQGAEAIGSIPEGETIEMIARTYSFGWIEVRYRGVVGWVVSYGVLVTEEQEDNLNIFISISGPIEAIEGNTITIYNIEIVLDDASGLSVGMVISIEGYSPPGDVIVVTIVQVIVIIDDGSDDDNGDDDDDDGDDDEDEGEVNYECKNPPPPWAPAHGWRRKCE